MACRLLWLWHVGSRVRELSRCSTWASVPHGTRDLISPTRVQAFLDHQGSPLPSTLQWMLLIRQCPNSVSWPWLPHMWGIRTSSLLFTVFNTIHLTHVKRWEFCEQQQSWKQNKTNQGILTAMFWRVLKFPFNCLHPTLSSCNRMDVWNDDSEWNYQILLHLPNGFIPHISTGWPL